MSTENRLSKYRRDKPDHEEECLCWDANATPHIASWSYYDKVWFDREYNVIDVVYWREFSELTPE